MSCISAIHVHDGYMLRIAAIPLFMLICTSLLVGQASVKEPVVDTTVDPRLSSLKSVMKPLGRASNELDELQNELKEAATAEAKQQIQERIDSERERVRNLRSNFRDVIGGAEAAEYEGADTIQRSLQQQFSDLLQPLFGVWREATMEPRELESLKASLGTWKGREHKAGVIINRIDQFSKKVEDPQLKNEFESARKFWEGREAEAVGQIGVLQAQLRERAKDKQPFFGAISDAFSRFFKSRGLNLLLGILTGALSFLATRKIYFYFQKISPVHRQGKHNLATRISDIMALFLSIIASVIGVVVVFYIRGDWLLLTLVLVLLLGAVWAGKESLPPYVEQIRMLLNLGSVREGERVVYEGLPWEVKQINFFTILHNSRLQGGELRMPIRNLMGMMSREPDAKEPWFPTETNDWVVLSDETYGKVITQTPEQVVVLRLGGSFKTYATTEFLSLSPENLSHGFRLSGVFGVDYKHQPESTTVIPDTLQEALMKAVTELVGNEVLISLRVELLTAGASSLDYQILADFDGEVASRYQSLQRTIQGVCVDTCNEHAWVIPFTQITVHQADGSKAS